MDRRWKLIELPCHGDLLMRLFRGEIRAVNLPPDAVVVRANYDPTIDGILLAVSSGEWPPAPEMARLERHELLCERVEVKA